MEEQSQSISISRYYLSTKVKVEELPKTLVDKSVPFLSTSEVLLDTDGLISSCELMPPDIIMSHNRYPRSKIINTSRDLLSHKELLLSLI